MKRVTFEIAKTIKDAGYPQDSQPITEIGWYNRARTYTKELPQFWEGDDTFVAVAPTYLEVWLWLWREGRICLEIEKLYAPESYIQRGCVCGTEQCEGFYTPEVADPEEAIIAAITYLVDNDKIK